MTEHAPRFVVVGNASKLRAWRNPMHCQHGADDICSCCDFDGFYERLYPAVPWRTPE